MAPWTTSFLLLVCEPKSWALHDTLRSASTRSSLSEAWEYAQRAVNDVEGRRSADPGVVERVGDVEGRALAVRRSDDHLETAVSGSGCGRGRRKGERSTLAQTFPTTSTTPHSQLTSLVVTSKVVEHRLERRRDARDRVLRRRRPRKRRSASGSSPSSFEVPKRRFSGNAIDTYIVRELAPTMSCAGEAIP